MNTTIFTHNLLVILDSIEFLTKELLKYREITGQDALELLDIIFEKKEFNKLSENTTFLKYFDLLQYYMQNNYFYAMFNTRFIKYKDINKDIKYKI